MFYLNTHLDTNETHFLKSYLGRKKSMKPTSRPTLTLKSDLIEKLCKHYGNLQVNRLMEVSSVPSGAKKGLPDNHYHPWSLKTFKVVSDITSASRFFHPL